MPSDYVWRVCKTELILCHIHRHECQSQISNFGSKLSKNSRQHQNKINKQEAQINSLQNQNEQLRGLLDPMLLVSAISQSVTTSLKMNSQPVSKGGVGTDGPGMSVNPI